MNLLITGCCGHIGSYLVSNIYRLKKIKKVFLVDNLISTPINSIFNNKKINNSKFYKVDLAKKNSLNMIKKIDFVIHLASMTNAEKVLIIKIRCMKII